MAQAAPGRLRALAPAAMPALAAFALFVCYPDSAIAAEPVAGAGSALPAGSIFQVLAGLAAVLALVAAAAWLLKRFSSLGGSAPGLIRIVGAAALGQRERIVLVEVGGTWLLVGVAPGQVRALHTMPRAESAIAPEAGAQAPADTTFSTWLRRMTQKAQP